jgi:hypothetical protein
MSDPREDQRTANPGQLSPDLDSTLDRHTDLDELRDSGSTDS